MRVAEITFEATRRGDPLLQLVGCDLLEEGERAVVLSKQLASQLGVSVGDVVRLKLSRGAGDAVTLDLTVKAIDPREGGKIGAHLDAAVHENIERYLRRHGVPEYGWPASLEPAAETYTGYLIFCKQGDDLGEKDREYYEKERNFRLERVEDESIRTAHGLLRSHDLPVYLLRGKPGRDGVPRRLQEDPDQLAQKTPAEKILVPWCDPQDHRLGGEAVRLVGFSLPERTWLRKYLRDPATSFDYDAPEFSVVLPTGALPPKTSLSLPAGEVPLNVVPWKGERLLNTRLPPPAVVPVQLLAHLDMERAKLVRYDPIVQRFVPLPEEISFSRARLFARTIDEVPAVVAELRRRDYVPDSQNARIREIQQQDASLEFIVVMVSIGVLIFGVFTVANVLLDSTARKRGTLGILRVMGVSQGGVFVLVFLRSAMIGCAAGVLSILAGLGIAWASRLFRVGVALRPTDLAAVFVASVGCCVIGSLYPAWTASRIDPYETIIEGKFR